MPGKITKSSISQSLSWTHYIRLMRISDQKERASYEIEAANNSWSVKELNRQFDSALYQRLALSRDKDKILVARRAAMFTAKTSHWPNTSRRKQGLRRVNITIICRTTWRVRLGHLYGAMC